MQPYHDKLTSDHFPIIIKSDASTTIDQSAPRWRLSAADWCLFQVSLDLPTYFETPELACEAITNAIKSAAIVSVPTSSIRKIRRSAYWWNEGCYIARNIKNKAHLKYKKHRGDMKLWYAIKRAEAIFKAHGAPGSEGKLVFFCNQSQHKHE